MKLQFDANQEYQLHAINAITSLFEGQPLDEANTRFHIDKEDTLKLTYGVGNNLMLSEEQIIKNLKTVQSRNEIQLSDSFKGMNFSVEMETGTGKTYAYLRTIYELSRQFGFKKFVIVVPSVPIREGVLKTLQITHDHFQDLYDKIPLNFQVYDSKSKKFPNIRSFASNDNIEILIINIASFAEDRNIINRPNDKLTGQRPIEFIQVTRPIVMIDEPQKMETEIRKKAIANLNPLCTLRYSATHLNPYNLVYSLNPVKAYDLGLVKQIEVDSVISENNSNQAFIQVVAINATKTKVSAKIKIKKNTDSGVKTALITVKVGDDIYYLSNEREIYKEGFIIEEIDVSNKCITFSNGTTIEAGKSQGGMTDEIMKFQIRKTIEEHLKKEKQLNPKGIKVLSLFFIDKVSNYRSYDVSGRPLQGKFAKWFEEIYSELSALSGSHNKFKVSEIHDGYFSSSKTGRFKDTTGKTRDDDGTYKLIMRDKERLLNIECPLRFIFSHSALREGWDNPNVFQICTLNETQSDIKKRQEIGRGLRLPVNQKGTRSYDRNVNRLTVIANEAYEDFAKTLQMEIEEDCGVSFEGRIKNKRERIRIKYRKGFEADPKFLEIWERIKHKTTYQVTYSTNDLIKAAGKKIKDLPKIQSPSVRSTKVSLEMTKSGIDTRYLSEKRETYHLKFPIPDVLRYIQQRTELTRSTILEILKESKKIEEILINPQSFLDLAVSAIQKTLNDLIIEGIKYKKIGTAEYEMRRFDENEIETYLNNLTFEVTYDSKTIYEKYIPLDSGVEHQFAKDCESSEQVEFYFKLPFWFKIPTPIGTYNPDWAVVMKNEKKIYFVAETKSTTDKDELRKAENQKIQCGKRHFEVEVFKENDVEFKQVTRVGELS